jgi:hypothetical protein
MNIHIKRELDKWKVAFTVLWAFFPALLVFGVCYLIYLFPFILVFAGIIIIPHLIGEYFMRKYEGQTRNDAFIGGEEVK